MKKSVSTFFIITAMFLLAIRAQAQTQIVAAYSFNDGTAIDISGNGHDGTLYGDPAVGEGKSGAGLLFDGVDDYVSIPAHPDLELDSLTLTLWIMIEEAPGTKQTIVEHLSNSAGYKLWVSASSTLSFSLMGGSPGLRAQVTSPYPLFPGVWTAVSAIYDGHTISLYMHGEFAASSPAEGFAISSTGPLLFARSAAGNGQFFNGFMDHISIWDGAILPERACMGAFKVWDPVSQTCIGDFTDATDLLGVGDQEHRHFGIAVVDMNNDGWVDLYYPNGLENPNLPLPPSGTCPDLTGGEPPYPRENENVLYLNNGDGTFVQTSPRNLGSTTTGTP